MRNVKSGKVIPVRSEKLAEDLQRKGWVPCPPPEQPTKERQYYTPGGFGQR